MAKNILPAGFYDLIFRDAEESHKKINLALDFFMNKGYRLIKPPLIEFAQGDLGEGSFVVADTVSGKNMKLRSDITPQISRIVGTNFAKKDFPLRVCYVGDVLLTKSDELYADRQSTQLGLEIVGYDNDSYLEVISMILDILPQILSKKAVIEFSLPNFAEFLCEKLGFGGSNGLLAAIRRKDVSEVRNLALKDAGFLMEVMLKNDDLRYLCEVILANVSGADVEKKLHKALQINDFMIQNFKNVEICFDLFADHRNSYHKEVAFDVFCEGFSYPIVRGGGYEIDGAQSVGATIYMNYLRKV